MWKVTSMYGTPVGEFVTRSEAREAGRIHLNRTGTLCDIEAVKYSMDLGNGFKDSDY